MPKRQKNGDDDRALHEEGSPFVLETFPYERFRQDIAQFLAAWDTAEAAIKEAELFRKEVVFASIKELRYAGRRFADALKLVIKQDSLSKSEEEDLFHWLREATENCIRARNDAVDALISYLHRYFHRVKTDYGPILMSLILS